MLAFEFRAMAGFVAFILSIAGIVGLQINQNHRRSVPLRYINTEKEFVEQHQELKFLKRKVQVVLQCRPSMMQNVN